MSNNENNDKLRTRSAKELTRQMEGLVVLSKVLDATLDRWFLSGGTLLGAYRDGDFIPWDWDVEVTVLTEEAREKEGALLKGLLAGGFGIVSSDSSRENFKIVAAGWGTEYEILGRYLKESERLRARMMTEVPARFFETPETLRFRGHDFPAPSPTDDFLEALYGDWRTPLKTADKESYFSQEAYRKAEPAPPRPPTPFNRLRKMLQLPQALQEFPAISLSQVQRFASWDPYLGWCNEPNRTKIDRSDRSQKTSKKKPSGFAVFSTDELGSRICRHPTVPSEVSCYGDSYCMCRDVHDEQTFPWHLGDIRGSRVGNYGVGNYGLDQAILRLQKHYSQDPSKYVVLEAVTITMARCVSVYRHYLEPGNIFAIKPRFRVGDGKDQLHLVEYPFEKKEQLLNLIEYRDHFRSHDEHYCLWRKNQIDHYVHKLRKRVGARFGISSNPSPYKTFEYEISFWRSHEALFLGMMAFYQQLADQHGFKPVFLLQHHKRSLEYLRGNPPEQLPWASTLAKASEKFPAITFLDEADIFADHGDIETLYTRSHHSSNANRMIAEYLDDRL